MRKTKYQVEDIINVAFELLKEKGTKEISARKVASRMNASTAIIYSNFENINVLLDIIIKKAEHLFKTYINQTVSGREIFDAALGYIKFARDEKKLFRIMFLNSDKGFDPLYNEIMEKLMKKEVLEKSFPNIEYSEAIKKLKNLWRFVFGYATLLSMKDKDLDSDEKIYDIITDISKNFK